jgi:hypothetical protein
MLDGAVLTASRRTVVGAGVVSLSPFEGGMGSCVTHPDGWALRLDEADVLCWGVLASGLGGRARRGLMVQGEWLASGGPLAFRLQYRLAGLTGGSARRFRGLQTVLLLCQDPMIRHRRSRPCTRPR